MTGDKVSCLTKGVNESTLRVTGFTSTKFRGQDGPLIHIHTLPFCDWLKPRSVPTFLEPGDAAAHTWRYNKLLFVSQQLN